MSTDVQKQILITRAALEMISDIHEQSPKLTFPHVNRTGLALSQVFDLLEGLDPLAPYYIKNYTVTTTADSCGNFNWTLLPEYISDQREILASYKSKAEQAAAFLAGKLFHDQMPDYMKVYRACAFLCGYITFNNNTTLSPNSHNAYGALVESSCGCQGFSHALNLLLKTASVPCMYVSGTVIKDSKHFSSGRFDFDQRTKAARHTWNLVGIETTDGLQYFHVDVCWGQKDKEMNLDYFLKDDAYMKQFLKWDDGVYPACSVLPGGDMAQLLKENF